MSASGSVFVIIFEFDHTKERFCVMQSRIEECNQSTECIAAGQKRTIISQLEAVFLIRTRINQILDTLPEEELENVYWAIEHIRKKYFYNWSLFGKGVKITNLFEESQQIIALWEKAFTHNISEETKRNIHFNQFRWHIFSYEQRECLKEEAAREAFDNIVKEEIYVMYQRSPYVMLYSNASDLQAADFDEEQDIYLFDKSFAWTYVHTHESMCGPYFAASHIRTSTF